MKRSQLEQIKKTIVFIGGMKENDKGVLSSVLTGTGFLINVDGLFHLLTAKHVVCDVNDKGEVLKQKEDLYLFTRGKDKDSKVLATSFKLLEKHGLKWFFHPEPEVDLAISHLPITSEKHDIKTVPASLFLGIGDVHETNEVFFLSYQPGVSKIETDDDISPIIRGGIVSRINSDRTFYIDGAAFPGNSGSPVFMLPSAARFTEAGISFGDDELGGKLVGVIGSNVVYKDIAVSMQTKRPRVIFEENTGLSKVWSISRINEIVAEEDFKENVKSLKAKSVTQKPKGK